VNVNTVSVMTRGPSVKTGLRYLCLQRLLGNLECIELCKNLDQNGIVGASGHGLSARRKRREDGGRKTSRAGGSRATALTTH